MVVDEGSVVSEHLTVSLEPKTDVGNAASMTGLEMTELGEDDDENPRNWPLVTRWSIVISASLMTMIRYSKLPSIFPYQFVPET